MVEAKTDGVIRRRRARIPSWLEAAPSLHPEAAYIEADRFLHQMILLAIRRRTIHSDPTTSGRFFFHVMASLAEMERELTIERTQAGLKDSAASEDADAR
jgi:hypothetical protein